jgi:hypothetical protein
MVIAGSLVTCAWCPAFWSSRPTQCILSLDCAKNFSLLRRLERLYLHLDQPEPQTQSSLLSYSQLLEAAAGAKSTNAVRRACEALR